MNVKHIVPFILMALIGASVLMGGYSEGKTYHGFKLKEKRFVKEVNADCYYFEHIKSGAKLLKIAADDNNKTFCISFKTVPENDCGTPHIMEHSVLNGSKNFPVKSPFDVLSKGSLNTFLNAMTGKDMTLYPVASMNNKDYFNLMHVYLDAVLNPLIYEDERIFQQEGWHHELMTKDDPVVYNGVVYNEMKGAFSSPTSEVSYQMYKNLFPDITYGKSSGGYPSAIPKLTYEMFLDFHRKFYHPSNSYIHLYGDADLDKELEFINREYLSNYEKSDTKIIIPHQKSFKKLKEITGYYAVPEGSNTENQSYLSLSFVIGSGIDQALALSLDILSDVLVNHESAPIRLALQEAGIGMEVGAGNDQYKQNVFNIQVQNANPDDAEKFYKIIMNTLKDVAEKGIDKDAIEGTLNRREFHLREGDDAQKGMTNIFNGIQAWFYSEDPFLGLEYEKTLKEVKKAMTTDLLESIIKEQIIPNPHSLLLVMEPKPGLEKEITIKSETECAKFKKSLSNNDIEKLVKENLELVNVVYAKFLFDANVCSKEMIPYLSLFTEFIGDLNTDNYSFGDLDNALNIHTGGFNTYLNNYLVKQNDDDMITKFTVSIKTTNQKMDKLFELTEEIVNKTVYSDKTRLKSLLTRHQSRLDASIKQNGFGYAKMRANSYYSNQGVFNELSSGIDYYWFITDLLENFDDKSDEIISNFEKIASLLFTRNNIIATVTCEKADLAEFKSGLKIFIKTLENEKSKSKKWEFDFETKNEGLLSASKVQYAIQGWNYKKLGYEWNGSMRVLNQVLSRDWLYNQIRVIGGAYGGFCMLSPNGSLAFGSYRDPNLKETLDTYKNTPKFLEEFNADKDEMTRYIIGTISNMDSPLTPSQKGNVAVRRYFQKITLEDVQKDRDEVLATTPNDIRNYKQFITDMLNQNAYCIYGNEEKLQTEKDLFKKLIKLTK